MDSIFSNISITILTAIISGFLGAWFQYWFQNRKVNKVRVIAISKYGVQFCVPILNRFFKCFGSLCK